MELLYEKVIQAFKDKESWFTDKGLKAPAFIDFYMGQPDEPDDFEFVLPAIFIDYSSVWRKDGRIYIGETSLSFHALPEITPSTSSISMRRSQGLNTVIWYRLVRQVLDTVSGEHFSRLTRGTESPAFTRDFKYHVIQFNSEISDTPGTEIGKYVDGTIEDISVTGNIKSKFTL